MMNLTKKSKALKAIDNLTPSVVQTFFKAFALYRSHLDLKTHSGEFVYIDSNGALFRYFETLEDRQNLKPSYYETMSIEDLRTYVIALPHKNI
jgi:hypothetical protein